MNNFYHFIKKPGLIAGIAFFAVAALSAQTTVEVTVSINQFAPSNVTIDVGDQVRWTNTDGFHNVNGTQGAYPENPESFGNDVGSGWVYSHTFTTPGVYNYHCDPHQSLGMTGTVTVNETTGIFDRELESIKTLYPNPARNILYFELDEKQKADLIIEIYTVEGKLVKTENAVEKNVNSFTVDDLENGYYFLHIKAGGQVYQASFIKQ